MSLNHSSIVQATIQSSRVFNRYSYRTEDTIAEVQQPGYFLKCQFALSDGPESNGYGWRNAIIDCRCADGFFTGQIDNGTGTLTPVNASGGGAVFAVGLSANYFGATAGDIAPDTPSVLPAFDRAEAARIRDAYQAAHPEWAAFYLSSPDAGVFLTWKDGTQTDLVGQQLLESGWVDVVSAVGVQGPDAPQFVDFSPINNDCIPALYRAESGNPYMMVAHDSGLRSTDGKLVSDRMVVAPGAQGFNVGTATLLGGAGLARLHDNVSGADMVMPVRELTPDGTMGLSVITAGGMKLFPSPIPPTGVGFGNPLDFFVVVDNHTIARSLFLQVPAGNPAVSKVMFRVCAGSFGSDRVLYDSYRVAGGETLLTFPAATVGNERFEIVLAEPILFRRGEVYYVTVFTSEIGANIVLVGETVPTPLGSRFIPTIEISGQDAGFESLVTDAGVLGITPGQGIAVDSSDPSYPVVSSSGIIELWPADGSGLTVDSSDPSRPIIGSSAVLEVSGTAVDNKDPRRPVINIPEAGGVGPLTVVYMYDGAQTLVVKGNPRVVQFFDYGGDLAAQGFDIDQGSLHNITDKAITLLVTASVAVEPQLVTSVGRVMMRGDTSPGGVNVVQSAIEAYVEMDGLAQMALQTSSLMTIPAGGHLQITVWNDCPDPVRIKEQRFGPTWLQFVRM